MSREGDWMCSSCQHLNFKKRDSCQRCRCPKFGGGADVSSYGISRTEVLAGDWYCNAMNCGAHNYASRTSCYRCGATKDDYYGGMGRAMPTMAVPRLDGNLETGFAIDMDRLGCGVHNYASRTECFKCGTSRDFGGADYGN